MVARKHVDYLTAKESESACKTSRPYGPRHTCLLCKGEKNLVDKVEGKGNERRRDKTVCLRLISFGV